MHLARLPARALFHTLCVVGRPFGGVRPRRLYDIAGRRAYPAPAWRWARNNRGDEFELSPHLHLDRNILAFGTYDAELHAMIDRLVSPGMTCFDVGANLGEVAIHLGRRVGPAGVVHAFEPAPPSFSRLVKHVERNGLAGVVRPHAVALSNRIGTIELAFPDELADNQGLGSVVNLTEKAGTRRAIVPTTTLDPFVAAHAVGRLDLMKIDIQGAEPFLLAGGADTLRRLRPDLLMEISPDDLRHAGATPRSVAQTLEQLGYHLFRIRRGRPDARIDADAITDTFEATNVYCTRAGSSNTGTR